MNRTKVIILSALVFVLTIALAFYYENSYRIFVRFLFIFFQGNKIKFFGKNFHLFATSYFVISFGVFSALMTMLLYRENKRRRLVYLFLSVLLFFITTAVTTYIDSFGKVVECTACQDGIRSLHYNAVNYDFHFIISLLVALLPLLLWFLKMQLLNRRKKPAYNIGFVQ
jgi:hypothetical protein